MSENVGGIDYTVGLDTSRLIAGQRKVNQSLASMGDAGDRLSSKMSGVGIAITSMFAAGAIIAQFAKAAQGAKLFEAAIDNLSAITGATGNDLKFLENAAKEFGNTTSASALQTVEAMKLIASAKPELLSNAAALKEVTAQAVILADASGMALPQAAESLTLALNQMGVGADQAGRFINVMAAGAKFGASEIAQSSDALKQFAVSARGVGLSIEEANAGIQALAAVGIKGAEAGTGLRNVLLKLENETDQKLKPSINGLSGALENLGKKNLDSASLTKMFGLENINTANALIGSTDQIRLLTTQLTGTDTALEQANINTDNYAGSIKRMQNALESAYIEIGTKFNPILKEGADLITNLAVEVSEGSNRIDIAMTAMSTAAVVAAGSLSGPLVVGLYASVRAMTAATVAARVFTGVMAVLGGPVGIAITALGLLALNWDKITSKAKTAAQVSEDAADRIAKAQGKSAAKATKDLQGQLEEAKKGLSDNEVKLADNSKRSIYGGTVGPAKDIEELKNRRDAYVSAIRDIKTAMNGLGGGGGRGSVNPNSVIPDAPPDPKKTTTPGATKAKFDSAGYLASLRKNAVDAWDAITVAETEAMRKHDELIKQGKLSFSEYESGKKDIAATAAQARQAIMETEFDKAVAAGEKRFEEEKRQQEKANQDKQKAIEYGSMLTKAINPVDALRQEYDAKLALVTQYEQLMAMAGVDATEQGQLARTQITNEHELQRRALAEQTFRSQGEAQAFLIDSVNSLSTTATSSIMGLLNGTMTAQDAMRGLANTVLNEAVSALVQIGVQQIKNAILGDTLLAADKAKKAAMGAVYAASVGAQVAGMSAMAAQNAFAATAAIPIIGPGLAPAAAAAAGAMAAGLGAPAIATAPLAGARQYGGPVSSGGLYRVNETGAPEMFTAGNGQQYMMPTKSGQVTAADSVGGGKQPWNIIIQNAPAGTTASVNDQERTISIAVGEVANQISSNSGKVWSALRSSSNVQGRM